MPSLTTLIGFETLAFIMILAAVLILKVLTGEIYTSKLLYGRISGRKRGSDYYFSPERLQLLLFSVAAGFYYLTLVLDNPRKGILPDIPNAWPAALGGSNVIYLAGKAAARWLINGPRRGA
jgi:hypothetical protein